MGGGGFEGEVGEATEEAPEEAEAVDEDGVGDGGFWIGAEAEMKKEEDHDSFADAVTADADGQGGGGEDEDENEACEGVVDGEIEGVGQEGGTGEAGEVHAERDEDDGDRIPTAVDGIAQAVEEIEDDGAGGEFLREGEIGKKPWEDEGEKKEKGAEGTKPGERLGERGEGGVGAEAVGGSREEKKRETEESGDAEDAVQKNGESGAGFLLRKPAQKIEEPNGVSASGADEEEVKEEADEGEMDCTKVGEVDFLEAQNKIKSRGAEQDGKESDEEGGDEPAGLGGGEAVGEAGPVDFASEKTENAGGDAKTDPGGEPI